MSDIVVGAYGLRTFRVDPTGRLLPINMRSNADDWKEGTCTASCQAGNISTRIPLGGRARQIPADHRVPDERCTCGIYSFRDLQTLRRNYVESADLVAVIRLEGTVLEGTRGQRAELARVVALWLSPVALPAHVVSLLRSSHPDVTVHADLPAMIATYPGLTIEPADPPPVIQASPTPPPSPAQGKSWTMLFATAAAQSRTLRSRVTRALDMWALPAMAIAIMTWLFAGREWVNLAKNSPKPMPDLAADDWELPHYLYALSRATDAVGEALTTHPTGWMVGLTVVAATQVAVRSFARRAAPRAPIWFSAWCLTLASAALAAAINTHHADIGGLITSAVIAAVFAGVLTAVRWLGRTVLPAPVAGRLQSVAGIPSAVGFAATVVMRRWNDSRWPVLSVLPPAEKSEDS